MGAQWSLVLGNNHREQLHSRVWSLNREVQVRDTTFGGCRWPHESRLEIGKQ